jgi:hypothetical protein
MSVYGKVNGRAWKYVEKNLCLCYFFHPNLNEMIWDLSRYLAVTERQFMAKSICSECVEKYTAVISR